MYRFCFFSIYFVLHFEVFNDAFLCVVLVWTLSVLLENELVELVNSFSQNCRGLKNMQKTGDLFKYIRTRKYNIASLFIRCSY